ncbi:MAG: TIGR02678 family protein [Chitinophagales bacterium]
MSTPGPAEQRKLALQDLLDRPVISRSDEPEAYRRIVLHERYLKAWFGERPQWRILTGRGLFRLERMPSLAMPERGLPRLKSQMAYACLCWVLWFAETMTTSARDWFVISELAERIAAVAEGRFRLAERAHREALVQALQFLVDLGGLILRDGDTDRWVAGQETFGETAEVMYEFAESGPRLLANYSQEALETIGAGEPGSRTAPPSGEPVPPLNRAWRALLLGPVFWRGDDPEAFTVLAERQEEVHRDLETTLGWQLECGRDYARLWRTTTARHAGALLLDLYPEPGVAEEERHTRYLYHPILLLLQRCRQGVEEGRWAVDSEGAVAIPAGELHDLLSGLRSEYRRFWGAELGSLSLGDLVRAVLAEMRRTGLLRGPDRFALCHLLPTAAAIQGRYRLTRADEKKDEQGTPAEEEKPAGPDCGPQQATLF